MRVLVFFAALIVVPYLGICALLYFKQDALLFFPTHFSEDADLGPWVVDGQTIGYCHEVANPSAVWLMPHGNGGQADQRSYLLRRMSNRDSLYVLEYPGYGLRPGKPSTRSINAAAQEAYRVLREKYRALPVCVVGESMGSGPACYLASGKTPPDKLVLIVPFDVLSSVAAEKFSFFPVRLLMKNDWDNESLLKNYRGPVDIFGAIRDEVIPFEHAKNLAAHVPQAGFHSIIGGHGWADTPSEIALRP